MSQPFLSKQPNNNCGSACGSTLETLVNPLAALSRSYKPVEDLESLELLAVLGGGASGTVYKVFDSFSSKLLALKVVPKDETCPSEAEALQEEQTALRLAVGDSRFLQLKSSFHDTRNYYFLTALHEHGDLDVELRKHKRFPLTKVRFYAAQLIVTLEALHMRGILHRDIKPENILFDARGNLVIADFGLARVFDTGSSDSSQFQTGLSSLSSGPLKCAMTDRSCGTPQYAAPEVYAERPYSYEVDFWALGVVIYLMITGNIPWDSYDEEELAISIMHDPLRFEPRDKVAAVAQDLLRGMLAKDPNDRFSIAQMKGHLFFHCMHTSRFLSYSDWKALSEGTLTFPFSPPPKRTLTYKTREELFFLSGDPYDPLTDPLPGFTYRPGHIAAASEGISEKHDSPDSSPQSRRLERVTSFFDTFIRPNPKFRNRFVKRDLPTRRCAKMGWLHVDRRQRGNVVGVFKSGIPPSLKAIQRWTFLLRRGVHQDS
ncbi:kinase-like domain-containing protein [Hygrophoropsis aurantiaca]|uniref:Kinase-like domain-containing protein n=1 Tax=Hygrophoropsis aurantiaca TaxID=72124 RepID=A0ACB8ACY3_9AGAM|nr:kinase-like domain-containing protein [Hygrophoropsis aurantiaca]